MCFKMLLPNRSKTNQNFYHEYFIVILKKINFTVISTIKEFYIYVFIRL